VFDMTKCLMKLQEKYLESVRDEFNLSRIEIIILTFLHNNPSYDSARDIVKFRMLQRGNVSAAVDTLEKKGYLIRYTDPDDKRIVHLKLTEQTDDIVRAIEEKQEALVSCIFAGFSEDEKKNFAAYNARLYQNVMSHLK
uniref:MarR family winged helix-turn-helix transcriptional regulator n=1 Tax=Wujia sp. TaxID=2944172 RepID=UPI003F802A04